MMSKIRLTLSQMTNSRLFQTNRHCRRQVPINENGRKLSKWVKKTDRKGETARYERFLLFTQSFEKTPYKQSICCCSQVQVFGDKS